jgi:hypothetical protein
MGQNGVLGKLGILGVLAVLNFLVFSRSRCSQGLLNLEADLKN